LRNRPDSSFFSPNGESIAAGKSVCAEIYNVSWKIKTSAEDSKRQPKIRNVSRRMKTSAENPNRSQNAGRFAGRSKTSADKVKVSADE